MKKRILITGSSGMLGKDIFKILEKNELYELYAFVRNEVIFIKKESEIIIDLTNIEDVKTKLNSLHPDIIIHCAALTDVNKCEVEKDIAFKLHVLATEALASFSNMTKFIYISTDAVYGGINGNYSENDTITPMNYYAKTKALGEEKVLNNCVKSYILRTNIFGFHLLKSNSLFEWAIDNFLNKNTIFGYDNVLFNPIYTSDLAHIVSQFVNEDLPSGIYNVGTESFISKYQFLNSIRDELKVNRDILKKKSLINDSLLAVRPLNTTINISKLKKVINHIPDSNISLKKCITDYFSIHENHNYKR